MKNRHELDINTLESNCGIIRDGTTYIDARGSSYNFKDTGELYVMQPHQDVPFCPFMTAKAGDIGRDLPVRIKGMQNAKLTVQLYPYRDYYINWKEAWIDLPSKGWGEIPSALYIKVPQDAWGIIKGRSSTGWKRKLYVFEGVIDHGYIGQLCCLVHNPHQEPVRIYEGDKLAQFILIPRYPLDKVVYVDKLPETERGDTCFGSTDLK